MKHNPTYYLVLYAVLLMATVTILCSCRGGANISATTDIGKVADFGRSLTRMINGAIPKTQEQLTVRQQLYPAITQRRIYRALKLKMQILDTATKYVAKHGLTPARFGLYGLHDTEAARLLEENSIYHQIK